MTIYSLDVLLFLFGTSLLFQRGRVPFSSALSEKRKEKNQDWIFVGTLSENIYQVFFVRIFFFYNSPFFTYIYMGEREREGRREKRSAASKSLQSCPTLCDPKDGNLPGSPVPGILQSRTLEWVAIAFSNAWKWNAKVKSFSCVRLFETPWTAAY